MALTNCKSITFSLIATVLVLGAVACGEKEEPENGPSAKGIDCPEITTLSGSSINGTSIGNEITLAGVITDSKTGKGIKGVSVSDGYQCVLTDGNGVYQMVKNPLARKVYYTTPSLYEISLDTKRHLPSFYSAGDLTKKDKARVDFKLTSMGAEENEFDLIMIGDPQCYQTTEVLRYKKETVADIANHVEKNNLKHAYAVTLGDITFDSTDLWNSMVATMSNIEVAGRYLPFFQCIGNHDHNSLESDSSDSADDDYRATGKFFENFGPTDYSFNRGKAHVIVMDDIMVYSISSSSKPNGKTWDYYAGFSDAQYEWLKQDVANVEDKENTVVFLCLHIPFRNGGSNTGSNVNTDKHYADFLKVLSSFKEAHLMIGHTHYCQNWIHTGYVCKGGLPVYEHVHQAACGAWWAKTSSGKNTVSCVTGAPDGYNVYRVSGSGVKDWINKATAFDASYQLRVYNGDQVYTGTKGYQYSWSTASNTYISVTAKGNAAFKNAFVVEAWDDDASYCSVEFWQGGKKVGNFTRVANGACCNVCASSFWFNECGKNTDTWTSKTASHYWYYVPASKKPAEEKDWEVKFIRKIPGSDIEHTYTCNKLTTDYSEF